MSAGAAKSVGRAAPGLGMTEIGRGILVGTAFVFLACLVIPAFGILAALIVLQVVALALGWWFRPRIALHGTWPEQCVAGGTLTGTCRLTNRGTTPAYQLQLEPTSWPEAIEPLDTHWPVLSLERGEERVLSLRARCLRRGHYRLALPSCTSCFPFNLYRFATQMPPAQDVWVLPAHRRVADPLAGPADSGSGRRGPRRRWVGTSPEYLGTRPFVPGDSPRRIDARAWARLARPAVKDFHDESRQAVGLVLETSPGSRAADADFEAAVSWLASLAASLPVHAVIDTLVCAGEILHPNAPSLPAQIEMVHRHLAAVTPGVVSARPELTVDLLERCGRVDHWLFVGSAWPAATLDRAHALSTTGVPVTLHHVGGQAPPAGPAARELDWRIVAADEVPRAEGRTP